MANRTDTQSEVYDLLRRKKEIVSLLSTMSKDAPEIPELQSYLEAIDTELQNIKPGLITSALSGFGEGSLPGSFEGMAGSAIKNIPSLFGGEGVDTDTNVEANKIMREASEKENPIAYNLSKYIGPMFNPFDPISKVTGGILGIGRAVKGISQAAKIAKASKFAKPIELVENITTSSADDILKIGQAATKEADEIAHGIQSLKSPERIKTVIAENYKEGLRGAGLRGGISSGLISMGDVDPNDNLAEQSWQVVKDSALGYFMGEATNKGFKVLGTGLDKLGRKIPFSFGEGMSRMPDMLVKESLANILKLSKKEIEKIDSGDLNWLRQYVQLASQRGQKVIGGNRVAISNWAGHYSDTLAKRNQELIDLSVSEGKTLSAESLISAIKGQFKSETEKKAVERIFKDFKGSFQPSSLRIHGPKGLEKLKTMDNPLSEAEAMLMLKKVHGPDLEKFISEGKINIDERFNARDLYEFQKHLNNQIDDLYNLGFELTEGAAIHKKALKATADALNYGYKYLEPDIALKNPQLSIRKSAGDIRKALTLKKEVEKSMSRSEAEAIRGNLKSDVIYPGITGMLVSHAFGWHGGLPYAIGAGTAMAGKSLISNVAKGKFIPSKMKYEIGSAMGGHAPVTTGTWLSRPTAMGLDAYRTAKQASPPPPMEGQPPQEIEGVSGFEGFGSDDEWMRQQLGK